jgi:hypothetical protein
MRSSLQLLARAALLTLLAGFALLATGCAVPEAGAQGGTPYPGPTTAATTAATVAPTTAATVAPTTAAPTTAATVAPTVRPLPTPTRAAPLPNTSEGTLPVFVGLVLIALAGVAAMVRRRA